MEYLNGISLQKQLINWKTFDQLRTLYILYQLIQSLNDIHSQGIVHRDFKPDNIIILLNNKIKIIDFGISDFYKKEIDIFKPPRPESVPQTYFLETPIHFNNNNNNQNINSSSNRMGTPFYESPEQLNGNLPDPSDDIFSLGIITLELFGGFKTIMEKVKAIEQLKNNNLFPSGFEFKFPQISYMIRSMLKSDPRKRPTAKQLLDSPIFNVLLNKK